MILIYLLFQLDLEKRVKSSEDEKSLLLERCLSGESEVEELRQTIKTIQRKLDDSHAALQELVSTSQKSLWINCYFEDHFLIYFIPYSQDFHLFF